MKYYTYSLILFLFWGNILFAQTKPELKFNENRQFKIVQFSDIHWKPLEVKKSEQSKETIKKVVEAEKPDLIIITGDIVNYVPNNEGWQDISNIFASFQIPWAIVLGNHDGELESDRESVFDFLKGKPYFIGEKGLQISGAGNYTLPIQSSVDSTAAALLYLLDTQGKPRNWEFSRYEWIQFNQIEWYHSLSNYYTKENNGTPLPALAFFHIPLPEYNNIKKRVGHKREKVSSAKVNSGFFAALLDKNEVMATFCGHDHSNDYIGLECGIALVYGRKTGASGTSTHLTKGGRVILLHEGQRKFDTWIRTPKKVEYKYSY